jgi:hypothetical protein
MGFCGDKKDDDSANSTKCFPEGLSNMQKMVRRGANPEHPEINGP